MARTEVSYSNLTANSSLDDPGGTSLNAGDGNGHFVADAEPEETVLRVVTTADNGGDVTVAAGSSPPALAAGQGGATFTIGGASTVWLGPFESGRFLQSDGRLHIDVASGVAGTITAFHVPRDT